MPKAQAAADIMQAGVNTGVLVNDIISTYYQLKASKESERKAYEWAQTLRQDTLRQQQIENMYREVEADLAKKRLSFERMKWGDAFKMEKQKYADQKAQLARELTRQRATDVLGGATAAIGNINQQYNIAAQRIGG